MCCFLVFWMSVQIQPRLRGLHKVKQCIYKCFLVPSFWFMCFFWGTYKCIHLTHFPCSKTYNVFIRYGCVSRFLWYRWYILHILDFWKPCQYCYDNTIFNPFSLQSESPTRKRRKVSHNVIDLTNSPSPPPSRLWEISNEHSQVTTRRRSNSLSQQQQAQQRRGAVEHYSAPRARRRY